MPKNYERTSVADVVDTTFTYVYGPNCEVRSKKQAITARIQHPIRRSSRSFSGGKTANWKQFQRDNGYLPTRPAQDLIIEEHAANVETFVLDGCGNVRYSQSGGVLCGRPDDIGFPDEYMDVCWAKLMSRVANADFNAVVTAAEAKKTVNFVLDRATTYFKAYRDVRRGKFRRAMDRLEISSLDGSARNWLSYKFGWTPLLMDAKNSAETFARWQFNSSKAMRYLTTYRTQTVEDEVYTFDPTWAKQKRSTVTRQFECKTWVIVRNDSPTLRKLAEVGVTNPSVVLWEITPFSWVADYFLGIGSYIQNASALDHLTVLDCGRSWTRTDSGVMYQGVAGGNRIGERSSTYKVRRFQRETGRWTTNIVRHVTSSLKESLSFNQLANMAALIRVLSKDDKNVPGLRK